MPSHHLNQCWVIVHWTLRNKFQWNMNRNKKKFIHENAFEHVCEMTAILSRGRWVRQFMDPMPRNNELTLHDISTSLMQRSHAHQIQIEWWSQEFDGSPSDQFLQVSVEYPESAVIIITSESLSQISDKNIELWVCDWAQSSYLLILIMANGQVMVLSHQPFSHQVTLVKMADETWERIQCYIIRCVDGAQF